MDYLSKERRREIAEGYRKLANWIEALLPREKEAVS